MSTRSTWTKQFVASRAKIGIESRQRTTSRASSKRSRRSIASKTFKIARANLDFDVFGYRVHFVFTNDLCRARGLYDGILGHNGTMDSDGTAGLHAFAREGKHAWVSYIFLEWNASPNQIAHESSHAVERMFDWAGITKFDGEVIAYHYGWLVGQIMSFQKKKVRGKR